MKYVLTGSLGHINKPVVQKLVAANHDVYVITSKADKKNDIESMGAKAAVGTVEDEAFVKSTLAGADAVYLMIPPKWSVSNWIEYQQAVANIYIEAIKANNIKHVALLSSVGAHMRKGAGPVDGLGYLEEELLKLKNVNAVFLRPSYFYYNLFSMIPMIKHMNMMGSNQPANTVLALTHTDDIADVVVEVLEGLNFTGQSVRYIASSEHTWTEVTEVLTKAVGKPGTPWIEFTDEQARAGMLQAGLPPTIADGYVELGIALKNGEMQEDYFKNKPAKFGKISLEDFSREFAGAYAAS